MLSVRGIYNGKQIKLIEAIPTKKRSKVIITFLEEDFSGEEENEMRDLSSKSEAFTFWNNSRENIYQDYLKK